MDAIRIAVEGDVAAVRACVRAAYEIYLDRMAQEPAPMTADYEALVADGVVHVLDAETGIVGVLLSFAREGDYFVENVAVLPQLHGQGLGRRLMAFAEDLAREADRDAIELYTNAVMTENRAFYPRLGYALLGEREEDGFARVYFRKSL